MWNKAKRKEEKEKPKNDDKGKRSSELRNEEGIVCGK